ncbi:MAG: glycosyltransferase [Saprospiraceae bacterium]|nr:glycosyltransferase [Saprospiraceae bacterium]
MSGETDLPVSVVICARNEAVNLSKNLPLILAQNYPCFEVIVVNHASTDNTEDVITDLMQTNVNLMLVDYADPIKSKRPALLAGLGKSKYRHILVTDADCAPSSSEWMLRMVRPLSDGYKIVVGASPLVGNGNLVSCFVQSESALIYLQYATATLSGFSYMGVGRNMAYLKELYLAYDQSGFNNYIGGDDDLFVSGHQKHKIALVDDPKALMYSEASLAWSEFFSRKHRHVSVSWEYSFFQKLYLTGFASSHWSLLICSWLLAGSQYGLISLSIFLIRNLLFYHTIRQNAKPFLGNCSFLKLLLVELIYLVHYPKLAFYLLRKPPKEW